MWKDLMKVFFVTILILTGSVYAQVIDVNGDQTVGPHEAIAVAEQWKGPASQSNNNHNHLGQTWNGERNPLVIRGSFPDQVIIGPAKEKGVSGLRAPLILDNTAELGSTPRSDLLLGGVSGIISARDEDNSSLSLYSNSDINLWLDHDSNAERSFVVRNGDRAIVLSLNENGRLQIEGTLITGEGTYLKIDHPVDPANKYLVHSSVASPEMKNVYDGIVALNENGEAVVQLPEYFLAFNTDYRYQLTCVGGFAPVYVAEEVTNSRFKIAGGQPGMKVSWQVTGIRQDACAKANPIEVEQEKAEEERGKYLHPELFGKPVEKSIGLVHTPH